MADDTKHDPKTPTIQMTGRAGLPAPQPPVDLPFDLKVAEKGTNDLADLFNKLMFNTLTMPMAIKAQMSNQMMALARCVHSSPELYGEYKTHLAAQTNRPVTSTLPAIRSTALSVAGGVSLRPLWVRVSDLPTFPDPTISFISEKIWGLFAPGTHHGDILSISSLMHGERVTKEVADFIRQNTSSVEDISLRFGPEIDMVKAYAPQLELYKTRTARIKIVTDPAGTYVYAWPHDANKTALKGSKPTRQLP